MTEPQESSPSHSRKLEALGRLAGGVAHDFNNLLTVIIGGLDMILKDPTDTERVARLAAAALAAGRRGETLTRQILAFARRQDQQSAPYDVGVLVAQVEPLLRIFLGESIDLNVTREPDLEPCLLDPAQFESALINLVVNAKDAVGGPGEINISVCHRVLADNEISDLAGGTYAAVDVSDSGPGMSPEVLARAFTPFFTTKEDGKGTGFGLAQVYDFARQAGGCAHLANTPGGGLTATLLLPFRPGATAAPVVTDAASIPPTSPG